VLAYLAFLSYQELPVAGNIFQGLVDGFFKGQRLSSVDFKAEVKPRQSFFKARAKLTFVVAEPSSRIFFSLGSGMDSLKVVSDGRNLDALRLKSLVCVDLEEAVSDSGVVVLDVTYEGCIKGEEWKSVITPDFVYLDPEDGYYPGNGGQACPVHVEMDLPHGMSVVTPGPVAAEEEKATNSFSFPGPVSSFSLTACCSEPLIRRMNDIDCVFYGFGVDGDPLADSLVEIQRFFENRFSPSALGALKIIKSPERLGLGRCLDDAGTVLLPPDADEMDLAFVAAWYRIKSDTVEPRKLFSREELAGALALYFIHRMRGTSAYTRCLFDITEMYTAATIFSEAGSNRFPSNGDSAGFRACPGAYLLSIVRRLIGDAAFERTVNEILAEAARGRPCDWRRWSSITRDVCEEELNWLYRGWASEKGSVDFEITDFDVEPCRTGVNVRVVVKNKGSFSLPEKVGMLLITDSGVIRQTLQVPRSKAVFSRYVQDDVLGAVIDARMQWFDIDRSNNFAYIDSPPYLAMPSDDNMRIAVAYHKKAGVDGYPLVVLNMGKGEKFVFNLPFRAGSIEWINSHRLLVRLSPGKGTKLKGPHCLIDYIAGRTEFYPAGVDVSASETGGFLLFNERKEDGWFHKLKDLDRGLTRNILNTVKHRLAWLPGTDLVVSGYPFSNLGVVAIYSLEGEAMYWFPAGEYRLGFMHGLGDGVAFLREKNGSKDFFTLDAPRPANKARHRMKLSGDIVDFSVSELGSGVLLKELLSDGNITISSYDLTRGNNKTLYSGTAEEIYDLFFNEGLLIKKTHTVPGGKRFSDIEFHRFGETEGEFITDSMAPERILALVGNQRYLYYTEEIQAQWSTLSVFNRSVFYCYDFLNRERKKLDFTAWAP